MNPMDFIESLDPQILVGVSVAFMVIVAAAFLFSSKKPKGLFLFLFYVDLVLGYRCFFFLCCLQENV